VQARKAQKVIGRPCDATVGFGSSKFVLHSSNACS
jgi:hypothetical protein